MTSLLVEMSAFTKKHDAQRAGLYAGWEIEFRVPKTAAD